MDGMAVVATELGVVGLLVVALHFALACAYGGRQSQENHQLGCEIPCVRTGLARHDPRTRGENG